MITNEEIKIIRELIEKHENIYLFHHVNPDGDCTASSFGLAEILRTNYPNKKIKVVAGNRNYSTKMEYVYPFLDWDNTVTEPEEEDYLAIVGDTSVNNRVEHFSNFDSTRKDTICFDHHENELDFEANVFWHESDYPAAGIMVEEMVRTMGWKYNERGALLINHGIVTDTGGFRFNYNEPSAQRASANLLEHISKDEQVAITKASGVKTKEDIAYNGHVMANFEVKGKVAYFKTTQEVLDKYDMHPDKAARPYLIGGVEGIEVWVLFTQYPEFVRCEYRSAGYPVNEVAEHFGGGGHAWAAGSHAKSMDDTDEIIDYIAERV